jgi:8-oxo-dGTP pyrophosphatase MutT (NUDIX family)
MSGMNDHARAVERLRERLRGESASQREYPGHAAAAVALLLVNRDGVPHLPFTVRSAELPSHKGQISFPGGKVDDADDSFAAAALRETHEELGVSPARIAVLGELADVPTPTGFTIRPVVCAVEAAAAVYRPNPGEVAEVFETPLHVFADPSIREDLGEREYRGISYRIHAYHVDGRRIWGATARMVDQLVKLFG